MVTSAALAIAPYQPRRTESLGLHVRAGWNLKVTGISADGNMPSDTELGAVLAAVEGHLPRPARPAAASRAGFVIVHRGTEALWVQLCWWELDIMYQRLLRADLGTTDLRLVPPDGPAACVWELLAIDQERRAWVNHVLRRPADPDISGYLSAVPDTADGEP